MSQVSQTTGLLEASAPAKVTRYRYTDSNGQHLHELNVGGGWTPLIGTSTACGVIGKPLHWYASGMALTPLGWLNPRKTNVGERRTTAESALLRLKSMGIDEYEKQLQDCYRAHHTAKEQAAGPGVDMHAQLERYVNECIESGGSPILKDVYESDAVEIFAQWAAQNVQEFLFSEAHCYSEQLWTGGICDVGAILKTWGLGIIDFKSSREAYFSQFVQAGGYAFQIQENGLFRADGKVISSGVRHVAAKALIIFPFGGKCEPKIMHNVEEYKRAFESAVCLHKLQSQYDA